MRLTTPGSIVLSFPEGQNPEGESAGVGERGGVDSTLEEILIRRMLVKNLPLNL